MSVKTQNLAIIFTDIVGYTEATHQKSRQQNENLVKNHNKILYPLIRKFKGRLVKTIGDALLVTFNSPTDAMLSAMAMQDALHEYNQTVSPAEQIHIRIAASLGEVRVVRNDIFGEAVNVTSRIEAITPADEIYLSEAVYLAMNKAEVPAQEVGYRELKGIPNQIKIFTIPRFSVPRLVPEQVGSTAANPKLHYPFGGMHLIANSSQGVLKNLPELPVSLSQMFRQPWTWPAAAIAAIALVFYGVLTMWSPEQQKVVSNTQTASTNTQAAAPILDHQNKLEAVQDPTPHLIDEIASGSHFMRNLTQIDPKAEVKEEKVTTETVATAAPAIATPNAPNQVAALQPQNVPLQNIKPSQAPQNQPAVRPQVPPAPVRQAPRPAQYTTFSGAKQAYRDGKLSKENYKNIIRNLDEQRDAELRRVKDLYRSGKILRSEYEQRYYAVKRKYE